MQTLFELAEVLGERLKVRGETVAVAESSSAGLISAALLSVAGASKYYLGGAVVYTGKARMVLMDLPRE
ncbi:CinA family protein, partial [Phenylobacterium sp.]|uniref:CinA family protein n=1 Tax=Phenylobacterium sp. TaxID=1871053 RepID=UPI003566D680